MKVLDYLCIFQGNTAQQRDLDNAPYAGNRCCAVCSTLRVKQFSIPCHFSS